MLRPGTPGFSRSRCWSQCQQAHSRKMDRCSLRKQPNRHGVPRSRQGESVKGAAGLEVLHREGLNVTIHTTVRHAARLLGEERADEAEGDISSEAECALPHVKSARLRARMAEARGQRGLLLPRVLGRETVENGPQHGVPPKG